MPGVSLLGRRAEHVLVVLPSEERLVGVPGRPTERGPAQGHDGRPVPGQGPSDYIAVDCGSEMEAYEVFRNADRPPFDWRHASFQSMEYAGTMMHSQHERTADSTLIADVVRTLCEGAPVTVSLPASINSTNLARLSLFSDELPGLMFCPAVYRDSAGPVYLAESFAVEYANRTEKIHAQWIQAGDSLAHWLKAQ